MSDESSEWSDSDELSDLSENDLTDTENIILALVINISFEEKEPTPNPVSEEVIKSFPLVKMDDERLKCNDLCCICRENYSINQDVLLLPCNHFFDEDCIKKWFCQQNTCPVCCQKY